MRPPTKSAATGFMAAALAMGLATAGLLWWKLAQPEAEPPPPIPTSQFVAPVERHDVAPPPPPPSAVPEAAPKPVAAARTGAAPSGCTGGCNGSAPPDLQGALRAKAGAARSCYERALRQNPMLQGRMTVAVRVNVGGRVCGANIVENSLGDASVASCVLTLMRSGTLPAPSGGCVDVQIPMSFVGKM